jgi:hypothetical protein
MPSASIIAWCRTRYGFRRIALVALIARRGASF